MNKRVLLAGVLGAVAMFLWSAIAHMALPLGEAGIKQIPKEEALLSTMQSTLSEPGFYIFPNMAPGNDQAQNELKLSKGPSGILIYFPRRDFSFAQCLAVQFVTQLVQALIAMYLLSLTGVSTFAGRLGFFAFLGLIAAIATNVPYWNWYGFPAAYTLAYMFSGWVEYIFAGLVAAAMKIGGLGQAR